MDMEMPVMDGHTATRLIRKWEKDRGRELTPIVVLTANTLSEMAQMSLAAGCTVHMTKPIQKAKFIEIIAQYAGSRES
jgi:CheY-like chemotaxis protein